MAGSDIKKQIQVFKVYPKGYPRIHGFNGMLYGARTFHSMSKVRTQELGSIEKISMPLLHIVILNLIITSKIFYLLFSFLQLHPKFNYVNDHYKNDCFMSLLLELLDPAVVAWWQSCGLIIVFPLPRWIESRLGPCYYQFLNKKRKKWSKCVCYMYV